MKTLDVSHEIELDWVSNTDDEGVVTYSAASNCPMEGIPSIAEYRLAGYTNDETFRLEWHDVSDERINSKRGPWRTISKAMAELQAEENENLAKAADELENPRDWGMHLARLSSWAVPWNPKES